MQFINKILYYMKKILGLDFFSAFFYEDYYDNKKENSTLTTPNSEFIIIENKDMLEKIINKNYTFDIYKINQIKYAVDEQAISFCIFVNKKLAHITWLALNDRGKRYVDGGFNWPLKINWSRMGFWGLAYTNPKFRKNSFYRYTHEQIQKFLLNKNIKINSFGMRKNNLASIAAMSKYEPKIIAQGYAFVWFKFKFRFTIPLNIK